MLFSWFNNPKFSDITVVVGEEQRSYFAHKVIIAECPYFLKCLDGPWKEKEECKIYKSNISPTTFETIMEYLYHNGWLDDDVIDALSLDGKLDLLEACEELQLEDLQDNVESQVAVTLDNVYSIWNRIFCYESLTKLQQRCLDMITVEYKKSRVVGRLSELTETAMDALLAHDYLWMNENLIAKLIRQWCQEDQNVIDRLKHNIRSEALAISSGHPFKTRVPPPVKINWKGWISYLENILDVMNLKNIRLEQRMAHGDNDEFTVSSFVDAWNNIDKRVIIVVRTTESKVVVFRVGDIWKEKKLASDGRTFYHFHTNGAHEIGVATNETSISKYTASVGQTMNASGHFCRLKSYSLQEDTKAVRHGTVSVECHVEITEHKKSIQFPIANSTVTKEQIKMIWMFQYQYIDD
eukprot:GILJ01021513.1.p1 GENE.GILJ01021513.1~~GILJ01021513.1.p1  ORF type:complete len:409 (+),score=38.45 GILJ01021513.1:22-1248(+)